MNQRTVVTLGLAALAIWALAAKAKKDREERLRLTGQDTTAPGGLLYDPETAQSPVEWRDPWKSRLPDWVLN